MDSAQIPKPGHRYLSWMKNSGMSLRYKILTALTVLPLVGLTLFLLLAIHIFEKDKVLYVFDSSLSVSKTKAARVRSEISSLISVSQSIVYSYSPDTRTLAESGNYFFGQESKFEAFRLFAISPETGAYEEVVALQKETGESTLNGEAVRIRELVDLAVEKTVVVRRPLDGSSSVLLALRFGEVTDLKHVVAITIFQAGEFAEAFNPDGAFNSFLSLEDGDAVFGNGVADGAKGDWSPNAIWSQLSVKNIPEGIAEISSPTGASFLASFVSVGVAGLQVVSLVDRDKALAAVNMLLRKSLLFFLAVLSATTIISVLASQRMTSALSHLLFATEKVAQGDFNVRVDVKAKDEIGSLANSFNSMAIEVSRLMMETADKARMESELATARAVQETLFPETTASLGPVEIAGHYEPASECGGDWWYYCENGGQVYLWIGDATGHGAPAALITSAARAVASVIQGGPPMSPGQAMSILNRAIFDASKGKMMMTFFLATVDKQTGRMRYANASHEAPLLLKKTDEKPSRSDYIPLNDTNNPRLGERPDIEFKEGEIQLDPDDQIVFYTDGVVDVKDKENTAWGERRFLKALSQELISSPPSGSALQGVVQTIADFRKDTPLDDDVTLILCKFKGAA